MSCERHALPWRPCQNNNLLCAKEIFIYVLTVLWDTLYSTRLVKCPYISPGRASWRGVVMIILHMLTVQLFLSHLIFHKQCIETRGQQIGRIDMEEDGMLQWEQQFQNYKWF